MGPSQILWGPRSQGPRESRGPFERYLPKTSWKCMGGWKSTSLENSKMRFTQKALSSSFIRLQFQNRVSNTILVSETKFSFFCFCLGWWAFALQDPCGCSAAAAKPMIFQLQLLCLPIIDWKFLTESQTLECWVLYCTKHILCWVEVAAGVH